MPPGRPAGTSPARWCHSASGHAFNPLTRFLEAAGDGAPSPLPFGEAAAAHHLVDAMYVSADDGGRVISDPER